MLTHTQDMQCLISWVFSRLLGILSIR